MSSGYQNMHTHIYLLQSGWLAVFCMAIVTLCVQEPVYYMSTEHLNITYTNPEYAYINASTSRLGRWDPKYYMSAYLRLLKPLGNNVTADYAFYEYRSNEYRRGFVEMHFVLCDLIKKDFLFGPTLRDNFHSCPIPAGEYRISNMSLPDLPILRTFPFRKARLYISFAIGSARLCECYVDVEIKTKPVRPKSRNSKN